MKIDDVGIWHCSLNLGDGVRKSFSARTGPLLVKALAEYLKPATKGK